MGKSTKKKSSTKRKTSTSKRSTKTKTNNTVKKSSASKKSTSVKKVSTTKSTTKKTTKKNTTPKKETVEKVSAVSEEKKNQVVEKVVVEEKKILKDDVLTNEYYRGLDLIRVIACLAVLFYHLNILKGGYLAVCTFFVLTGFLSCRSAFKKEKFSLFGYYKNRFVKVYVPLCIVVFLTILVVSCMTSMSWFNIKPDATSVLLGYNNFWQIGANLDYFARHINSPFMHFWYIGILLQFELIFPLIYKLLKFIGDKVKKQASFIIPFILAIISYIGFCYMVYKGNIMDAYYNSLCRAFSILLGIAFGFMYSYKNSKDKPKKRIIPFIYTLILILLFIFVDSECMLFSLSMMVVTLISCRLIDYALVPNNDKLNIFDKIIKSIASISYEIYLLQYPVIYLFQMVNMNEYIKIPIIIIIVIVLSYILHICIDIKRRFKFGFINVMKYLAAIIIFALSIYGGYQYYNLVDYTSEMKELENMLNENEKELLKHQEDYLSKLNEEKSSWEEVLNNLNSDGDNIKSVVDNLRVVGVGDSIMLGAVNNLYDTFKNGYFDAKVSRSIWAGIDILSELNNNKMIGDVVLINLGANGDCKSCKKQLIEKCGDSKVFFITVTNDNKVHVNDKFKALAEEYDNVYVIDWAKFSEGHSEYFYADKIHLNGAGRKAYTKLIYDTLYDVYTNEFEEYKNKVIAEHEEELKNKISFYGNDILLSSYNSILEKYPDSLIISDKSFDFSKLKERLLQAKKDKTLSYRVVLLFDYQVKFSKSEYKELLSICDNNELYILSINKITNDTLKSIKNDKLHIIDFYNDIKDHDDYLMNDYIHLTDSGIKALVNILDIVNG